jgi:predicted nucleic acid-binding protein
MNLVDSSGWLEYFADTKNAKHYAQAIEKTDELIVSTVNLFEVYKKILSQVDENSALQAIAVMQQAKIIEVTANISIQAAKLSYQLKIPMADSIIYFTALYNNAILWTQDSDFKGLDGVNYFGKK